MPYKISKIKMPHDLDRRRRLTEQQKQDIIAEYEAGGISMRALAKKYEVNKNTILRVVNPQSAELHNRQNKEYYYSAGKSKNNPISYKKSLAYKQELIDSGVIKIGDESK